VVAALLAAGASRRLGTAKQLVCFRGEPLVRHAVAAASTREIAACAVVLGANADLVAAALELTTVQLDNPSWREGIASSIRIAVAWAEEGRANALVLLLADQPLVDAAHVTQLLATWRAGAIAAATAYEGVVGVPAAFDARLFSELRRLRGDRGAAAILERHAGVVAVPRREALVDVDTPADLAALGMLGQ
jgi:molybdenum cofactor cytidylyltransferase